MRVRILGVRGGGGFPKKNHTTRFSSNHGKGEAPHPLGRGLGALQRKKYKWGGNTQIPRTPGEAASRSQQLGKAKRCTGETSNGLFSPREKKIKPSTEKGEGHKDTRRGMRVWGENSPRGTTKKLPHPGTRFSTKKQGEKLGSPSKRGQLENGGGPVMRSKPLGGG